MTKMCFHSPSLGTPHNSYIFISQLCHDSEIKSKSDLEVRLVTTVMDNDYKT